MTDPEQRERFAAYFPRVFAYLQCWADDDDRCREIAIEAFAQACDRGGILSDEDFPVALFSVIRGMRPGSPSHSPVASDCLSIQEREVLALMFDAQLARGQVGRLLQIHEDIVVSTLVRGLRKLQSTVTRDSNLSLQRL